MSGLPHDASRPLAQFHGGPWDGKTMYLDPFPRMVRVPVVVPITAIDPQDVVKPSMPVVEYTNEWMASYGRPDLYFPRDER